MLFTVNVDYPTQRAKVHRADCESLKGPPKNPKNGYRKDFHDRILAFQHIEQYAARGWIEVGPCQLSTCNP